MKNINIIEVNSINLIEKDVIEVSKKKGFMKIVKDIFKTDFIFKLEDTYYIIGQEVAYLFKPKEGDKI